MGPVFALLLDAMDTPNKNKFPVIPIRGTVLFPGMTVPLRIGRSKSIKAVESLKENPWAVVVSQRPETHKNSDPVIPDLYKMGTLVKIESVRGSLSQGFQVIARGVVRFRVDLFKEDHEFFEAEGGMESDQHEADPKTEAALLDSLKTAARDILSLLPSDTNQLSDMIDNIQDLELFSNLCAGNIDVPVEKKQELLETKSLKNRVLKLLDLMMGQKESLEIQSQIREKLTQRLGKHQRESILREQIRTIREELGEESEETVAEGYRQKIEDAQMPDEVKKTALEELRRFEAMGRQSPEVHVIRNYLDLLCSMPWQISSREEIDLARARAILEEDHYGLEKIKKRILEHLAVMKLNKDGKGSILLFVGPPGVGKTSLGQSIARALGRKFVRATLGGIRDDAEIRGHRRTYIGAMPGRIIHSIKRAGENNPVLMLDEIDKLAVSYQGDPAAALLEVLDPEQNSIFTDHYLDVPFDLSKVVFIATANNIERIPGPLLDRMEVIELSGYTTSEKQKIAERHLVPKQLSEHGMKKTQIEITSDALHFLILHYTREAGVRDLQRKIAEICRGSSEAILTSKPDDLPVVVERQGVMEILGAEKFVQEKAERISPPGVVTGLAWTPVGGDILFIEAELMPGTGKLTITGQLGEVMKESAHIALSLVRARLASMVPGFDFGKSDIHLHVPAGAIPKDGPSAGIALLTAIASLFSSRRVSPKIAMTGEITLRGAILPVGGMKEKLIAAHRAGIEKVILPKRNEKDLREVPDEVRSGLKIEFVETASDLMKLALGLGFEPVRLVTEESYGESPAASA